LFAADQQGHDPAWECYLKNETVRCLEVFQLLRWRYLAAVQALRPDDVLDPRSRSLLESMGRDLGQLYWHGQISFLDKDKLLDTFLANAPASITGKFMEDIGHWLHQDDQPSADTLERLKALWAKRFNVARPEELATFSWWFSSKRFAEEWSITTFLGALQKSPGYSPLFSPHLGERLAELTPGYTLPAVQCLDLIVKSNENGGFIYNLRLFAQTILTTALVSPDEAARRVAEVTINRLVRKGYADYRNLLPS
jgi:hypothetical protein